MAMLLEAPSLPETRAYSPFLNRFVTRRSTFSPVNFHRNRKPRPSLEKRARTIINTVMETVESPITDPPVRIVTLVGKGVVSPLKSAAWEEVMVHTARRLKWIDEGYEMLVFDDEILRLNDQRSMNLDQELNQIDILLVLAVNSPESVKLIQAKSKSIQNMICFESSPDLMNKLGGIKVGSNKRDKEAMKTVGEAWERCNSDDIRFCLLVIINIYIRPVPVLQSLRAKGFSTVNCMIKNCGPQVLNCLLDPNCRKALLCLNQCSVGFPSIGGNQIGLV